MKLDKEQRKKLNERLKLKRSGLPSNKIQLDLELKRRTQLANGRAKHVFKAMERSPKLKRIIETGAKAVATSVAEGEGIADAKKKVKALGVSDDDHAAALSLLHKNEPDKEK